MPSRPPRLILASGSPRRRELLARLGIEFAVRPAAICEAPEPGEAAGSYVLRLAEQKATARAEEDEVVLAADTIVVLDGDLLGKPSGDSGAQEMLARLSGRTHDVLTGVAVWDVARDLRIAIVDSTRVRFANLSDEEIRSYVTSGEPRDKAGAYAVQGLGSLFVERIEGSYTNVVGLPLPIVYRLLGRLGVLER